MPIYIVKIPVTASAKIETTEVDVDKAWPGLLSQLKEEGLISVNDDWSPHLIVSEGNLSHAILNKASIDTKEDLALIPIIGVATIEIQATSESEAIDEAFLDCSLSHMNKWKALREIQSGNFFRGPLNKASAHLKVD